MIIANRAELTPEEKRMSLAKYYDLPLYPPGPREMQLIDNCPIDPRSAIRVENFTSLLHPTGYSRAEYGYCMMDDGSGYMATYTVFPTCTPQMLGWWFRWLNVPPKGPAGGHGESQVQDLVPARPLDPRFRQR